MSYYEKLTDNMSMKKESNLILIEENGLYFVKQTIGFYYEGIKLNSFDAYLSIEDLIDIYNIAEDQIDDLAKKFKFNLLEKSVGEIIGSNDDKPYLIDCKKSYWPNFVNSADCQCFIDYLESLDVMEDLNG